MLQRLLRSPRPSEPGRVLDERLPWTARSALRRPRLRAVFILRTCSHRERIAGRAHVPQDRYRSSTARARTPPHTKVPGHASAGPARDAIDSQGWRAAPARDCARLVLWELVPWSMETCVSFRSLVSRLSSPDSSLSLCLFWLSAPLSLFYLFIHSCIFTHVSLPASLQHTQSQNHLSLIFGRERSLIGIPTVCVLIIDRGVFL